MIHVLFGLAVAALVVASPFVSRRLRAGRVPRVTGAAAVSPVLREDAGETAVTGFREERQAFAYDNGLTVEEDP
jgi:hypothetical protein